MDDKERTVKKALIRLKRMGVDTNDRIEVIFALEKEIDYYRDKIEGLMTFIETGEQEE